jgi:hypothetical protein
LFCYKTKSAKIILNLTPSYYLRCFVLKEKTGMWFQVLLYLILGAPAGVPLSSCPETLDAGPDIVLCHPGGQVVLDPTFSGDPLNIIDITWSPAAGLSNPKAWNPVANVNQNRTYTLNVKHFSGLNLFENGDFESGNVGFTSNYAYSPNNLIPEGVYAITPNPQNQHPGFSPCPDHTSGSGNMMAVNGAGTPNQNVWCQTVSVTPNTNYVFITWATSLVSAFPAILQFSANGNLLGAPFTLSPTTCQWQQFYAIWNSGNNSSVSFCIVNQNTVLGGNDFALDDIFLSEVCEYIDEVEITVKDPVEAYVDAVICLGESIEIGGQTFDWPGSYQVRLFTSEGCDSTVFLNLESIWAEARVEDPLPITCDRTTVTVDGSGSTGSGPIDQWQWSTIGGSILTDPNIEVIDVGASGWYQLKVGVTLNGVTCYDSTLVFVDMDTLSPLFDIEEPDRLSCKDSTLYLQARDLGLPASYLIQWYTNTGEILDGETTLNPHVKGVGRYFLEVIDLTNGCSRTLSTEVLGDTSLPQLRLIDAPILTCRDTEVDIRTDISGPGQSYSILWTTPNGLIVSGEQSDRPRVSRPGVYTLWVNDEETGCRASLEVEILENLNVPDITLKDRDTLGCLMDSISVEAFFANGPQGLELTWSTTNGIILSGANSSNPVLGQVGNYRIDYINLENGCAGSGEIEIIRFEDLPTVNAGQDLIIDCAQTQVRPDISGTDTGAEMQIRWFFEGAFFSNERNPLISAAGTYLIEIFNTENRCSQVDSLNVLDIRTNPDISISTPDTLTCTVNQVRLFNQTAQINNPVYSWTGPAGAIINMPGDAQPFVNTPGWYYVQITDPVNACISTDSVLVVQHVELPWIVFDPADTLDCEKKEIRLSAMASGPQGAISFSWSHSSGGIVSGANAPDPVINAQGFYHLTITNTQNGCTISDSISVSRNLDLPSFSVAAPGILTCETLQLTLQGSYGTGYPNIQISWTSPNGNILSGQNTLNPVVDRAGRYVMRIVNPDNGCEDSTSVIVEENRVVPNVNAGPDQILPCNPPTAILQGEANPGVRYLWSSTSGRIIPPVDRPEVMVDRPGIYYMLVTDLQNGCTAIDSVVVSSVSAGEMDISVTQPNCKQPLATIRLNGGSGGTAPYRFEYGGGTYLPGDVLRIGSGQIRIEMTDAQGCRSDTSIVLRQVIPLSTDHVDFIKMIRGDEEFVRLLFSRPIDDIENVVWDPIDGVSQVGDWSEWVLAPRQSRNYTIQVFTKDSCETVTFLRVLVTKEINIFVPNVFTPRDINGINDRFFPFTRDGSLRSIRRMEIFDRWGNRVFLNEDFSPNEPEHGWDGSHRGASFNPAVFTWLIEAEDEDGEIIVLFGDVTLL